MKLIHRIDLEVLSKGDAEGPSLIVTASWYRPFLDGGYKQMIAGMLDSGCFDGFMRSVINQLVKPGEISLLIIFDIIQLFIGNRDVYNQMGMQTVVVPVSPLDNDDDGGDADMIASWNLVFQFLGKPIRSRLTTVSKRHFLDIYFP